MITVARRRTIRLVVLGVLGIALYRPVMFAVTFDVLGYPVRNRANGWLGPVPRNRMTCVEDIGKVYEWKCPDLSVFEQHRFGCWLWLRLNGLAPT